MIRPASASDAPRVAELSGQLGYPTPEAEMRVRLADLLSRGHHAVLVFDEDGAAAGWIHVVERRSVESGPYAEIGGLVVDEARRGRKIGEKLVAAGEAWAKRRGLGRMRVRSNVVRERTHAFYKRLGYEIAKTQAVFHKPL